MSRRGTPIGLVFFALFQVLYAGYNGFGLLAGQEWRNVPSDVVLIVLSLLSAYGYLRRSRLLGLVGGNAFAIGQIGFLVYLRASEGMLASVFADGSWLSLIYPIVLLAFLDTRYRRHFVPRSRERAVKPARDSEG